MIRVKVVSTNTGSACKTRVRCVSVFTVGVGAWNRSANSSGFKVVVSNTGGASKDLRAVN